MVILVITITKSTLKKVLSHMSYQVTVKRAMQAQNVKPFNSMNCLFLSVVSTAFQIFVLFQYGMHATHLPVKDYMLCINTSLIHVLYINT